MKIVLTTVIVLFATKALALSPLARIGPELLDYADVSYVIQVAETANGSRDYDIVITRKTRDFRPGINVGLASVVITDTREEAKGGRSIQFRIERRSLKVKFRVTADELKNPDTAFFISEPVYTEHDGHLTLMPAEDFSFLWLREFPPKR